ncbi:MAG: DUF6282 family protein [Armatimonadota bacterium]|nr:DUF6282 family protein [Armatimonadota bacterium]
MSAQAESSQRARALVRGGYDLHVHSGPDVLPRQANDIEVARRFAARGLAGFAIKSHYASTAARACLARWLVPEVDVLGSICLNASVGGLNPLAVELAAREGARIVWMPTVDAENERHHAGASAANPPAWAALQEELRTMGVAGAAFRVVDGNGCVLPEVRDVLQVAARRQMVLATGHLSRAEIFAVVEAARRAGVRTMVVTHPDFPTQRLSVEDQKALARDGVMLERCFTTAHTGKIAWDVLADVIRAVGARHSFLSSDLGQPHNPPIEEGLALMADRLLALGVPEEEVHTMAVWNTVRIARGEVGV